MKLDLAAALGQTSNAAEGGVRAVWSGVKAIEVDTEAFIGRLVHVQAVAMGHNLHRGIRPDGSGPMPARKRDGLPRGLGAKIAFGLYGHKVGLRQWEIAAWKELPGHLARILGEVPLRPPPLPSAAVDAAFAKSLKVTR